MALLYALLLGLWFGLRDRLGSVGPYKIFAVAATESVQSVGM